MDTDTPVVLASPTAAPDEVARYVDDVDDEFFALVYSDEELLREEFAQLIAAAWASPPRPTPARDRGAEGPSDRQRHRTPLQGPASTGAVTTVRDRGARTRSPPNSIAHRLQD